MFQDEVHRTLQRLVVLAARHRGTSMQEGFGDDRSVSHVVPVRPQALTLADVRGFPAILSPAPIFSLNRNQPFEAFRDSGIYWVALRAVLLPGKSDFSVNA